MTQATCLPLSAAVTSHLTNGVSGSAVKVLDDVLRRMQGHQAKKSSLLRPLAIADQLCPVIERVFPAIAPVRKGGAYF